MEKEPQEADGGSAGGTMNMDKKDQPNGTSTSTSKKEMQILQEEAMEEGTTGGTGGVGGGTGTVHAPGAFAVYPTGVAHDDVDEIFDADELPLPPESAVITSSSGSGTAGSPPLLVGAATDAHVYDEAEHRDLVERKVADRMKSKTVEASTVKAIGVGDGGKGKGYTEEQENSRKPMLLALMIGCGLVCMIIALAVGFTYDPPSSSPISVVDEEDPVDETPVATVVPVPSPPPTNAPTMSTIGMLRDIVMSLSDEDTLYDITSPQYQALEWLAMEDDLSKTFMETIRMTTESAGSIMNDEDEAASMTAIRLLQERYAAATLYYSLNGQNWLADLNFLSTNETICNWPNIVTTDQKEGIQCDDLGYVNSLIFDGVGINGTIPKEIAAMSSLQIFQTTTGYDLYGSLPSEMDRLTRLKTILIYHSKLTGTIPPTFAKITNLEDFVISNAQLTGTIPHDLMQITSLEWFHVVGSQITGTIPTIDRPETLTKIYRILLENNQLTGTVPTSIYSLTGLKMLRLFFNHLTGTIPTEVGQLTNMENLDYFDNDLTGTIPSEIGNLSNMFWFSVDNNNLTGQLPSEMGLLERASWLVLTQNDFSGTIPTEFGNLERITNIVLLGNERLTGVVPTEFLELPALSYLNIGNTNMSHNALDAYCNQSSVSVTLRADCAGENPKVDCPCCAACFDYETELWLLDNSVTCEIEVNALDRYAEGRNTTCGCRSTIGGTNGTNTTVDIDLDKEDDELYVHPVRGTLHHRVCTDNCQSCSRDGTICAKNIGFGFGFNERKAFDERADVHHTAWSTYQYTLGRNDTIDFETYLAEDANGLEVNRMCNVYVNGQKCRDCERRSCADSWRPIRVKCDNIEGYGNVDVCNGISADGGPLTLFEWQDEVTVEGCTTFFHEL